MTYEKALERVNDLLKYAETLDVDDLDSDFNATVAVHMACKNALQYRIPRKVKYIEYTTDGYLLGYCPICQLKLLNENQFCYECGQALDWGD